MSEYLRIGEGWAFWHKYGGDVNAVDESLVAPVLASLGAEPIGVKWLSDSNAYRCRIGSKEFELAFDLRDDVSRVVDVTVSRSRGDERVRIGGISIQLPCEDWSASQQELQKLL